MKAPYLIIPLLYFCSSEIGGFTQSLPHILHPIWPFHYHFFILLKQRLHIVAHSMSTTIVGYIIALFSYWLVQYDIWCCFLRLMVMLFCQFCRLRLLWWALYIIYMIYFKPLFLCVCSFILWFDTIYDSWFKNQFGNSRFHPWTLIIYFFYRNDMKTFLC